MASMANYARILCFAVLASLLLPSLAHAQLDISGSELQTTRGPYEIVALEDLGGAEVVHIGEDGVDSIGDILVIHDDLFCQNGCGKGWDTNHKIGDTSGSCVRTVPGKLWHCTATGTFKWGSLLVSGPYSDTGVSTLAVIGGTGCFSRAQGTFEVEGLKGKAKIINKFTIYVDPLEDDASGLCKTIPTGKHTSALGAKFLK